MKVGMKHKPETIIKMKRSVHRGAINARCNYCGKLFHRKPREIRKTKKQYCSKECYWSYSLKDKHPSWKGGKSFEPYTIDWTVSLRRAIRERDNFRCKLCGESQGDRVLSVHHIDYNKTNCNPNNLISLCVRCHTKANFNREYWSVLLRERIGQ